MRTKELTDRCAGPMWRTSRIEVCMARIEVCMACMRIESCIESRILRQIKTRFFYPVPRSVFWCFGGHGRVVEVKLSIWHVPMGMCSNISDASGVTYSRSGATSNTCRGYRKLLSRQFEHYTVGTRRVLEVALYAARACPRVHRGVRMSKNIGSKYSGGCAMAKKPDFWPHLEKLNFPIATIWAVLKNSIQLAKSGLT